MKTKTVSFLMFFAISSVLITTMPSAFAIEVSIPAGTDQLGCEETNECYIPFEVTVGIGDTVEWSNDDTAAHTVTSGDPALGLDGVFDSSLFISGDIFEHTFDKAGEYPYFCMVHPWMAGIVIVEGATTAQPTSEPTAQPTTAAPTAQPTTAAPTAQPTTAAPTAQPTTAEPTTQPTTSEPANGGGCLIATATFGSELAPQIQQLRELRDTKLLQTEAGTLFMNTFNDFYYSFSPSIADYERENPVFKEMVRLAITPMISSLSILNYVDVNSEVEVLGYGISLILLNVGMYFVAPAIVIVGIKKRL